MKVSRKEKHLIYVYALAICGTIAILFLKGPRSYTDTPSYLRAWEYIEATGRLDVCRTPIYPFFLGGLRSLFPTFYPWVAIFFQIILSFISIHFFYLCANIIIKKERIALVVTISYTLLPIISTVGNNALLTESFSISGLVLLLYTAIKLNKKPRVAFAALHTLFLLFLIFLRPIFIYLLPVFVLFWVILIRKRDLRISAMYGFGSALIALSCVLLYMQEFKRDHGIFALTNVNTYNQLFITRQSGLLKSKYIKDSAFKEDVERCYLLHGPKCSKIDGEIANWLNKYDINMLNEAISNSYKDDPAKSLSSIYDRVYDETVLSLDWIIPMPDVVRKFFKFFSIDLGTLFLFILIFGVLLLITIIKTRMFPIWSFLLFSLVASNVAVIMIGAQNDFQRLLIPSIPLVLIMIGKAIACSSMKFKFTLLKDD